MHSKPDLREKAIGLRRQGKTYSEILKEVLVAKSTLSLWFHEVELAKHQVQRITEKRIAGQKKGAQARRSQRIALQHKIWLKSEQEIGSLSDRELWLIGIALYWAEGSKEKTWRPGSKLLFSNSDPRMIRVFLKWLLLFPDISKERIGFEIYIHENSENNIEHVKKFWATETGFPVQFFQKIYFKKNKIYTNRRNKGSLYNGLLRVKIPKSSTLLRKIEGWTRGVDAYCRIV
jgi:hypothetical protein